MIDWSWVSFVASRVPQLWVRTGEHILLTGISTGLAICLALPLGILASRYIWLRGPVLGAVGVLQTIPSLAMLAILLALMGKIGVLPAVTALTLYALLPIVRNTVTGLEGVSSEVMEAARGIGMTDRQQLWMVRMPLALPVIVAGIRTAAVVGVGIATLVAFIGAGGLGEFINRGLALSNTRLILLGAVPAGILALMVDFSLAAALWSLQPMRTAEKRTFKASLKIPALVLPLLLLVAGLVFSFTEPFAQSGETTAGKPDSAVVRIGSKNFSEQIILGEMMALMIEADGRFRVERRLNLGGTMICHGALVQGEIDLYPEYTGTALTAIMKHKVITDPDEAFRTVARYYREKLGLEWLQPFGFNNTYAITVRKAEAKEHGWKRISDLADDASQLRAGFTSEFSERPDGYPGLRNAYGFDFGDVTDLDPSIMYQAVAHNQVDVICAFATDGRIPAYDLKVLVDDRNFFPPYYAAPVVRAALLSKYPELRSILRPLAGLLDDPTMQRLNFQVDEENLTPREVAQKFLQRQGLLKTDYK